MLLTVSRVNPRGIVTIGGAVGVLRLGVPSLTVELTISELEAVKGKLTELRAANLITFSTSSTADQLDNTVEGATLSMVDAISKPRASATLTQVFVSQTGNDSTGDGTLSFPYATISRALQNYPAALTTEVGGISFRVTVIPPYTGSGFNFELVEPVVSSATSINYIGIDAYDDPLTSVNNVNDPRFTNLQGPLTSSVAAVFNAGYAVYDVPVGTVAQNRIGSIVRVFRAGEEVGRGILADIDSDTTDKLYIVASSLSVGAISWTPTAGDLLYLCNCAVVLNTESRIASGHRAQVTIGNIRSIATGTSLSVSTGRVVLASVQIVNPSSGNALHVSGPAQVYTSCSSTSFPWSSVSERLLTQNGSVFVSSAVNGILTASALAVSGGYINLAGSVVDNAMQASLGGVVVLNHWQRGSVYVNAGSHCLTPTGTEGRAVLGGMRSVPWNAPMIFVEGGSIGGNSIYFDYSSIHVVPAGYAAGRSCLHMKRAIASCGFQFNVVSGSGTLTTAVVRAVSFTEIPVLAGTIVGPLNQDIRAGATFAAFASIPLVDAATLTRIAPYNA